MQQRLQVSLQPQRLRSTDKRNTFGYEPKGSTSAAPLGRRSARYDEGLFVVEGELLVAEAFDAGWNVIEQFQSIDARDQFRDGPPVSFLYGDDFKNQ